jgi:hypothetical protein
MSDLRVTRLRLEDLPELTALKSRVYGREFPREDEAFYRWKFFDCPARGEQVPFWVLWDGPTIKGGIGALPVRMKVFDREVPAEFACDMFVEREEQRSGLGTVLMDAYIAESPWPLMMNTSVALHRFLAKRGFRDLSEGLRFRVLPLRPGAFLRERLDGWRGRLAGAADPALRVGLALRRLVRRPRLPRNVRVEEVEAFGGWADELWEEASAAFSVIVRRDEPYLRWKYERHPFLRYRILVAREGGRVRGYLTCRLREGSHEPLMIVQELFAPPGEGGARRALLAHAVALAAERRCTAVKILSSDPWTQADLARMAFLRSGASPGMQYPEQEGFDRPELRDLESWYLTGGDSDVDYE